MEELRESLDLSIREQLDAMGLAHDMLHATPWRERAAMPAIQPEVTPVTDSLLLAHDVILYHCSAPYQPDWNKRAWIWRFTLDLTVLGRDPAHVFRICSWLHLQISAWPRLPATMHGKVTRLVDNPGFESISPGDMSSSKSVVAWHSSKLLQAASPH